MQHVPRTLIRAFAAYTPTAYAQRARMDTINRQCAISLGSALSFHTINNTMGKVTYLRHRTMEIHPHIFASDAPLFYASSREDQEGGGYAFLLRVIERPDHSWADNVHHTFALFEHHVHIVRLYIAYIRAASRDTSDINIHYSDNHIAKSFLIYHPDKDDIDVQSHLVDRMPPPLESFAILCDMMIDSQDTYRNAEDNTLPVYETRYSQGAHSILIRIPPASSSHHATITAIRAYKQKMAA